MKNLFISYLILLFGCSSESGNTVKAQEKNTDFMSFIYKECKNPDILEIERSEDNYIEIDYFCNGKRFEMGIKDNALMFIETAVELSEIPIDKIKNKLEKDYKAWTIDEVSDIKTTDTSFYKVEVIKEGVEQNLYFTKDGRWFKFNTIDISEKWNLNLYQQNKNYMLSGYNFFKPEMSYDMPELLKEISGISIKDTETIYCVQDEIGAIFEFEMKKDAITRIHRFSDIGDFEDLAIFKDKIYVLRSDGLLFPYQLSKEILLPTTIVPMNSLDIEGLCTWKNSLYLASKAPQVTQDESKRSIFKVEENKLNKPELYLDIEITELVNFVKENYPDINADNLQFNPSALAFHPKTEALYILSAEDRILCVFKDKKLQNVILLPSSLYYKPEGIAFTSNGDLYISNEGDKKGFVKGNILFFKYDGSK